MAKLRLIPVAIDNDVKYGYVCGSTQLIKLDKHSMILSYWGDSSFSAGINIIEHKDKRKILNIIDDYNTDIYTVIGKDKVDNKYIICNIDQDIKQVEYTELRELMLKKQLNCFVLDIMDSNDTEILEAYGLKGLAVSPTEQLEQCKSDNTMNNFDESIAEKSTSTGYEKLKQLYYGNSNQDDNKAKSANLAPCNQKIERYSRGISANTLSSLFCEFLENSFSGDRLSIPYEVYAKLSKEILSIIDESEVIKFKSYTETGNSAVAICKRQTRDGCDIVACQIMWKSESNERFDLAKIKYDYNKWKQSRKYL